MPHLREEPGSCDVMCIYTPANQHLEPKSHEALGIFFSIFLFIFCWWIFRDSDPLKSVILPGCFFWKKILPSFEALLFGFRGPRASKASKWHHGGHDAEDGRGLCSPCVCDGWSNLDVYPWCWWAVIRFHIRSTWIEFGTFQVKRTGSKAFFFFASVTSNSDMIRNAYVFIWICRAVWQSQCRES